MAIELAGVKIKSSVPMLALEGAAHVHEERMTNDGR